jgi:hypothetical protein
MILDRALDIFRGQAITIPPLDGAFRPNTALDDAETAATAPAPDHLCVKDGRVLYSSATQVGALASPASGQAFPGLSFDRPVAALATSKGGRLAVALADGAIVICEDAGGRREIPAPKGFACPTALAFGDEETLYVCHGSARHGPADWALDFMEKGASGAVWRTALGSGRHDPIARGLSYPHGILVTPAGLIVSESWRHRLLSVDPASGATTPILSKLPGYPGRLAPAPDGGAWLALFAPRNRLIEFVLLEDNYRHDMMRSVERQHWIAPALSSGRSFLEPLQCGSIKTMGIHKPWAPSRSYGLVARLDARLRPVASFHSRANSTRHGATSVVETGAGVFVASKGGDAILRLTGGA